MRSSKSGPRSPSSASAPSRLLERGPEVRLVVGAAGPVGDDADEVAEADPGEEALQVTEGEVLVDRRELAERQVVEAGEVGQGEVAEGVAHVVGGEPVDVVGDVAEPVAGEGVAQAAEREVVHSCRDLAQRQAVEVGDIGQREPAQRVTEVLRARVRDGADQVAEGDAGKCFVDVVEGRRVADRTDRAASPRVTRGSEQSISSQSTTASRCSAGMSASATAPSAPPIRSMEWIGIESIGVPARSMEWIGIVWIGIEFSWMEWIGIEWMGAPVRSIEWIGIEWIGELATSIEWIGIEWIGVPPSSIEWIGIEWIGIESQRDRVDRDRVDRHAGQVIEWIGIEWIGELVDVDRVDRDEWIGVPPS